MKFPGAASVRRINFIIDHIQVLSLSIVLLIAGNI
jgi:hypothetical protein